MKTDLNDWHLARSERRELHRALRLLASVKALTPAQQSTITEVGLILDTMLHQVERGIHRNPPLVIFGNPPMRQGRRERVGRGAVYRVVMDNLMSNAVHEVRYVHIDDGRQYKHAFSDGVDMWAGFIDGPVPKKVVVLQGSYDQPLWEDFK